MTLMEFGLFWSAWWPALPVLVVVVTLLWLISLPLKNVSIIDIFWGMGFVIASVAYWATTEEGSPRRFLILCLVAAWGLRLSLYIYWRNAGHGEDFRYAKFREDFGSGYWWYSYFSVFLLQGVLVWIISPPLLGSMLTASNPEAAELNGLDLLGVLVWTIGFVFEAGGDFQMARFKANPKNRGKVCDTGFWRYTRHPNYFGDSAVWVGYTLICFAGGMYWPILSALLMIALIIKVSGVMLLEKTLVETKPQYREYIERTSAFLPWPPKRR
ncbi:MAG: DUF1295 domain-containing protein [bacterium]